MTTSVGGGTCICNQVEIIIPTTVREEVLFFFVRSTFGSTTLVSCPFEIVFTHGPFSLDILTLLYTRAVS